MNIFYLISILKTRLALNQIRDCMCFINRLKKLIERRRELFSPMHLLNLPKESSQPLLTEVLIKIDPSWIIWEFQSVTMSKIIPIRTFLIVFIRSCMNMRAA